MLCHIGRNEQEEKLHRGAIGRAIRKAGIMPSKNNQWPPYAGHSIPCMRQSERMANASAAQTLPAQQRKQQARSRALTQTGKQRDQFPESLLAVMCLEGQIHRRACEEVAQHNKIPLI